MAFLGTVPPVSTVHGSIAPLTRALARHTAHLPLALILPALLLTDEHAEARLVAISILAVVEISIRELPDPMSVGYIVLEVSVVEFTFGESVASDALHATEHPASLV